MCLFCSFKESNVKEEEKIWNEFRSEAGNDAIGLIRIVSVILIASILISVIEDSFSTATEHLYAFAVKLIPSAFLTMLFVSAFFFRNYVSRNYETILIICAMVYGISASLAASLAGAFDSYYYLAVIQAEIALIAFFPIRQPVAVTSIISINLFYILSNILTSGYNIDSSAFSQIAALAVFASIAIALNYMQTKKSIREFNKFLLESTFRSKTEKELIESENNFYDIMNSRDEAVFILNFGRILECNDPAMRLVGARHKEQVLQKMLSAFSPKRQKDGKYSEESLKAWITEARGKGSSRFEWILRKAGKKDLPVEINMTCIPLRGRKVVYTTCKDISLKKEIDRRYREGMETASAFISSVTDIVLMIDNEGIILIHNEGLAASLGRKGADLTGTSIFDLFPKAVAQRRKQKFEEVCKTGKKDIFEDSNRGQYFRTNLYPVFNDQGEVDRIAVYSRDITHRKQIEEELENYRLHLEKIVAERTRELESTNAVLARKNKEITGQKEKLEQLNKEMKELNAAKDKFFSIIAHDLKNPLSSFRDASEMMSDSFAVLEKEEIKEFIDEFKKTSKNIYNLLENLLQWSRSQTGRIDFKPTNIDLGRLADNTVSLLATYAEKKGLSLVNEIPEDILCYADPNMITTVLRNLISNAIKFTEKGGCIIIKSEGPQKGIYIVTVADSGIGISKEDIQKLFKIDVYHTTAGTSSEKGTGLGLILCKEFVEINDGKIWVESTPGCGSQFKFTLPVAEGQSDNWSS